MDPVDNRLAPVTPRRRAGRPTIEEIAQRPPPTIARTDPDTGRLRCPHCGRPTLMRHSSGPRKSDGGLPHRCDSCGYRCVRIVTLAPL